MDVMLTDSPPVRDAAPGWSLNASRLLLLALIGILLISSTVNGADEWTPDSFSGHYRVYVNGTPVALADYQVKLVISNVSGTNSVENFYLPGIAQPTYNDVRFALPDNTPLSYWMETPTGSNKAIFWVKVPTIPQGSDTSAAIDIYFGNATIGSAADGDATFPFFDHFDGATLNAAKWSSSHVVSSSILQMKQPESIQSVQQFPQNTALRMSANLYNVGQYISFGSEPTSSSTPHTTIMTFNYNGRKYGLSTVTTSEQHLTGSLIPNSFVVWDLMRNTTATSMRMRDDPALVMQQSPTESFPIVLQATASKYNYYDWLLVRQYADTEPTVFTPPPSTVPPAADFSASVTSGDAPLTVRFTDTSTNDSTSWQWDFDNDGTVDATTQNPTHQYTAPGNYSVKLTTANAAGSNAVVKTEYISVTTPSSATADFNADVTSGIAPLTVHFTGTTSGIVTGWAWDFNNDCIVDATTQNPVYIFTSPGNYSVNLTVANAGGSNSIIKTDYIRVSGIPPVANFTTDVTSGNAALTVHFSDNSTGSISNWTWDFGDGTPTNATLQNPIHTYAAAGNYTVNLTVSGPSGSNSTIKTDLIHANSNIDLAITGLDPLFFAHYTANRVNANIRNQGTENATTFTVSFSIDGNTTSVKVPALAGGGAATIGVSDPVDRRGDTTIPITVTVNPDHALQDINAANDVMTTSASVVDNGYTGHRWSDGPDLTTREAFLITGDTIPSLGNSIYGSDTVNWTAADLPVPAGATIKDARLYVPYTWDQPGNMLNPTTMTFNDVVVPKEVHYREQKGWGDYWDYGYGVVVFNVTDQFSKGGNNAHFTHDYAPVRGMNLVVTYEDANATQKQVFINEGFDMLFASSKYYTIPETATAYAPFTGANIDMSRVKKGTLTTSVTRGSGWGTLLFNGSSWPNYWLPGAGEVGMQTTDVTPLLAANNNTALLRCEDTSKGIEAYLAILKVEYNSTGTAAPTAGFTAIPVSGKAPLAVQFTDDSNGVPTSWLWDFGDGNTDNATRQNPEHVYTKTGSYSVNLTVSNAYGSNSLTKNNYITVAGTLPVPGFSATPASGPIPLTVQFTDTSANSPTAWQWDFGDGSTINATDQNPVHTYTKAGTYSVNLTVTNKDGTTNLLKTNYITATDSGSSLPVPGFATDTASGRVPLTVQFTDTSAGSPSVWNWDFGDGGTSTERNPEHTYVSAGTYAVGLSVTGPGGANTTSKPGAVTVSAPLTSDSFNGGIPLTTVRSGTVSGGLWYDSYPGFATSAQKTFTLPAYTQIRWARLYVVVYDYNMQTNDRGTAKIQIDANGDGTYEITKTESFNTSYSFPGAGGSGPVWLSDHMNRVTSDYLMWYNLTGAITGQTVKVQASTSKIDNTFDGRIKMMVLVVAYDNGSAQTVRYWVNQGHDTVNSGDSTYHKYTGATTFGTAGIPAGWTQANLSSVYLASENGVYKFQGSPLASGSPAGQYFGTDTWDATNRIPAGQDCTLTYNRTGEYYKIPLALLSVKYAGESQNAPVTNFSVTAANGISPVSASFADTSANAPSAWKWEYRIADTGPWTQFSTVQNPAGINFANPGTYDIRLTATNAGGSNTLTKTHVFSGATAHDYLATVARGTVSGGLYVNSVSPWTLSNASAYSGRFTLPAAAAGNITWARLYVNTYSGSLSGNYGLTSVVSIDGNTLGTETLDVRSGNPANNNTYPVNDHVMKVASDYEAVYDVTGRISSATPQISVTGTPLAGYSFDGRIKGITLIAAYNDGDTDQVRYWVNHGNDWMGPKGAASSTTFDTDSLPAGWTTTELKNVAFSSSDAAYTLTNASAAGSIVPAAIGSSSYWKFNAFDINTTLTPLSQHTLGFTATGSSFKTTLATLAVRYQNAPPETAPAAGFTATGTVGPAPLTVVFSDQSVNATSWAWDFGDGDATNATARNPVHTYTKAGSYTVALRVSNSAGSDTMTRSQYVTVSGSSGPSGLVPSFSAVPVSGEVPLTVRFTDTSAGSPTTWHWDFGDGNTTDATARNPVHTYTVTGRFTVNLTIANGAGQSNSTASVKLITVAAPGGNYDLAVTGGVARAGLPKELPVFARADNPVTVRGIRNLGTTASPATIVELRSSDGSVNRTVLPSIPGGGSADIAILDTLHRTAAKSGVTYTAAVDPDDLIRETDETNNNATSSAYEVIFNGYMGKSHWEVPSNVTTKKTFDLRGGIVYSSGDSQYVSGTSGSWTGYPVTWTRGDLPLPPDAVVREARLYVPYTWDNANQAPNAVHIDFNGERVPYEAWYHDRSNLGNMYSSYEYGLMVYDVTFLFRDNASNTAVFSRDNTYGKISPYGFTLAVVYDDPSASRKQIFMNEDFDLLGTDAHAFGTTPEEATAYVPFSGPAVSPADIARANLTTFVPSGNGPEGILLFNGRVVRTNVWNYETNTQVAVDTRDVSGDLLPTGNEAWIRETGAPSAQSVMAAAQQFLVAEYKPSGSPGSPVAAFSADTRRTLGPELAVRFTDRSIGSPTGWAWDFGDNTTSADQNPEHVFRGYGSYTVTLAATNANGKDSVTKHAFVVLQQPTTLASFTATPTTGDVPLEVRFTDTSKGLPEAWTWYFGDNTTSADQNPVHTYTSAGTYTVTLLAKNANGPSTVTGTIVATVHKVVDTSFGVAGLAETRNGSAQTAAVDKANATVSGNTVTMDRPGSGWDRMAITMAEPPADNGTAISGTVASVAASSLPVAVPILDVGNPAVNYTVNLREVPNSSAKITLVITKEPDPAEKGSFTLAASGNGKKIDAIAYTVRFEKTCLANANAGGTILNATIRMAAGPAWVAANGGRDHIRILRRADDGSTGFLDTRFLGTDDIGNDLFAAISPDGLSTFILSSVSSTPSGDNSGNGGGGGGGSGSTTGASARNSNKDSLVLDYAAPVVTVYSWAEKTPVTDAGKLEIVPLTADIEAMPELRARWIAEISQKPDGGGVILSTIVRNVTGHTLSAYRAALAPRGLDVGSIAYSMVVTETDIPSTRNATVEMSVPQDWVRQNGGITRIRILRLGTDDKAEILDTSFARYDKDSRYSVFKGISPNGLCTFSLIAVQPASGSGPGSVLPASSSSAPAGSADNAAVTALQTPASHPAASPWIVTGIAAAILAAGVLVAVTIRKRRQGPW